MHNTNKKALVLMNLSAFFSGMVFYAPIATLYRQNRGISVWQMSVIEAISLVLMMALELPWGYIADRIGYRRTLLVSFLVLFISKIVFFGASTFPLFLVERILLAIALSALSGVDIAYLHTCKATQKEIGHYQGSMFLGLLAVALIFPFFNEVYTQSSFLTIISHLIALLLILLLPREMLEADQSSLPKISMLKTVTNLVKNKNLMLYVGSNAVLFGVNQVVTVFLAQLCYAKVGVTLPMFALPFLLLVVTSTCFSYLSAPLATRFGAFALTVGAFILSIAGLILLFSLQGALTVIFGSVLIRAGATLVQPLYFAATAKISEGSDLATSLSLNSLVGTCIELFLTLVLGFWAERSLVISLQIAGVVLIVALGALYYSRSLIQES